MVRIDLKPLKNGVHEFDWNPEPDELGLDEDVFYDLALHVRLDVQPDSIYARLSADGAARLICDRTLKPYEERISGAYAMLFITRGASEEDNDAGLDDVVVLPPGEDMLDLTEPVRDTYMLALPQRRVAPGADDQEIPMRFGAPAESETAVDPRWDALRTLRDTHDDKR